MNEISEIERKALRPVNPYAIEQGFLEYCEKKSWLRKSGEGRLAKYYVTKEGRKALKEYDIII
jgi:predicted transcriptional regulator